MRLKLREGLLYWGLRLKRALDRRPRDPAELGSSHIHRILAISNTALGDTLLSTPGLRALRTAYPDAHLTLVAHPSLAELFAGVEGVDAVVPYAGKWRGFWRALRALRQQARRVSGGTSADYDLAAIFHGNEPQVTPLAYLSGARFIFKLPNTNRFRFLLANPEPLLGWDDLGHGVDQRLAVAGLACGKPPCLPAPPLGTPFLEALRRMSVPRHAAGAAAVSQALARLGWQERRLIALQPGASTNSRRWPRSRFIAAARQLAANHPALRFVVTGSPAEAALCREVADGINAGRAPADEALAWASAGELLLTALPGLFARCQGVVSGDTGPMHLAVTVGTPVVALFAVSDPARSGPAYDLDRHIVIRKWRTCTPCLSKRCPYAEPICMNNISVDEVVDAVDTLLCRTAPVPETHG